MAAGDEEGIGFDDELMVATARTLATHGLGDLTTQRVADEWDKSPPLVHYYYDTKDDLVRGFIEYVRAVLKRSYEAHADDDPIERVAWLLKRHFVGSHGPGEPVFTRSLLEVQSQAAHNEAHCQAIEALDADARRFLREAIADGIEAGVFRDVDVDHTVSFLLAAVRGGLFRFGLFEDDDTAESLVEGLDGYIEEQLLAESVDPATLDLTAK